MGRLPPVVEPMRSAVERRDLLQRFKGRKRIEGFYRLKQMTVRGQAIHASIGYLVIGSRHLSMHLYAPSSVAKVANVQAVFRKYKIEGQDLVMTTLVGHRNQVGGDIVLEPIGHTTRRRFSLAGSVLRIHSGDQDHLEFERIE